MTDETRSNFVEVVRLFERVVDTLEMQAEQNRAMQRDLSGLKNAVAYVAMKTPGVDFSEVVRMAANKPATGTIPPKCEV